VDLIDSREVFLSQISDHTCDHRINGLLVFADIGRSPEAISISPSVPTEVVLHAIFEPVAIGVENMQEDIANRGKEAPRSLTTSAQGSESITSRYFFLVSVLYL